MHRTKPQKSDIDKIKTRLINPNTILDLSAEEILSLLEQGHTIQPGVMPFSEDSSKKGKAGTCADDFKQQTLFMLDHDNKRSDIPKDTPACVAEVLALHNLKMAFAYSTFSSTDTEERFRSALVCDEPITDKTERDRIQKALIRLFP